MREKMKRALLLFCLSLPAAGLSFAQGASTPLAKEPKIVAEGEKVKFVDEKGTVIKELSLAQEKRVEEREKVVQEWNPKLKESVQKKRKSKYDVEVNKSCQLSANQKYALLVSETRDAPAGSLGMGEGVTRYTGKIALYDQRGNLLFEKQWPYGEGIEASAITSDGKGVIITHSKDEAIPSVAQLYVFDTAGREILKDIASEIQAMSVNGRYLAVKSGRGTIFFDLEKGKEWKAERSYVISSLSDDGIVKVSYTNPDIKHTDPYEKRLKEGRIRETFDLKEHFGK